MLLYFHRHNWFALKLFLQATPCVLRGYKNRPASIPGRMPYKATKPGSTGFVSLHCALASCGAVYCNRSCLWVCDRGRARSVRTLLQPARAQCSRLSERFFHCIQFSYYVIYCILFLVLLDFVVVLCVLFLYDGCHTTKTAKIKKSHNTLQYIARMSMQCSVISHSFYFCSFSCVTPVQSTLHVVVNLQFLPFIYMWPASALVLASFNMTGVLTCQSRYQQR